MRSIRRQLTREILLAVLLLLCAAAAVFYFVMRDAAIEQFDATLRARALAINALADDADDNLRTEAAEHIMLAIEGRHAQHFFQITDAATGAQILRSRSLPPDATLPFRDAAMSRPAYWNLTLPNGKSGRAVSFSTPQGASRASAGAPQTGARTLRITLASDREDLDETLHDSLWLFAALGLILIVATIILVPRVLRRGMSPLRKLSADAARIDADTLSTRFPLAELPLELRPIAERLNELLARLEASFERERRFSSDLAHELRTPIAELRSAAECALKWPDTRQPQTDRDTLEIARQMERIVTNLLALARGEKRGEKGQLAIDAAPVALAPLLAEVWRPLAPRAARRALSISLPAPDCDTRCLADATMLRPILANLCANAAEYTTAGGTFNVGIQTHAQHAQHAAAADTVSIIFTNDTNTLTPDDMPKLFDRFWRKDASRTDTAAHSGLGLPLARALAQAMGWTLTARLAQAEHSPARLILTLTGPLAKTPNS